MDRKKVRRALDWLNEYSRQKYSGIEMGYAIENAIMYLNYALRDPDADLGDECECASCKVTRNNAETEAFDAAYDQFFAALSADECECDGCRAKTAEDELAEAFPTEPTSEDFGPCGPLEIKPVQFTFHNDQPSDYEIRLKAWNIAYSFEYADDCQFSATLAAATKLYNFLSGQNGDVK